MRLCPVGAQRRRIARRVWRLAKQQEKSILAVSAINFPAVVYPVDTDDANLDGDFVNHAVVADADAPIAFAAVVILGRKPGKVLLGSAFKQDAVHGHLRLRSARNSSNGR